MQTSERRGDGYVNLALLTDGLRAEREQGITIDVAYRYFQTAAAQVHHRRHAGPRAVHAQHGHRRLDRRSVDRAGRRPQGRQRADPPPRLHRLAAADPAPGRVRQQDGPRRLRRGRVLRDPRRADRLGGAPRRSPTSPSSRSRRCTATTSSSARTRCLVRRRAAALPPRARRDRARPQPRRRALPGAVGDPADDATTTTTTAATPARSPAACCAPGDEVVVLPERAAHRRSPRSTPTTASVADGVPDDVGDAAARRRARHLARRHDRRGRGSAPAARASSRRCVCWMSEQPLRPGARLRDQAHDPHGPRDRSRSSTTGSTSTRSARERAERAGAQRDRPRAPALQRRR